MRELDLDDRFWRDALAALAGGSRASALSSRYPELSACLAELEADASDDAVLIGVRWESGGPNPRLLSLLAAAFLARAGVRALLVDLSPDVRWLERLLGDDLKEGIVDHIQYGVPLERCVRETGLANLSILTGGAHFLAGSPLDDAPALRGALDRLRQRHRALVMTLPGSEETIEPAGLVALCDVLLAVEEGETAARLTGCERAVIRLTGSRDAAEDLARLAHRFLGPLPAFLEARPRSSPTPGPATGPPAWSAQPEKRAPGSAPDIDETAEDLAFLAAFEETRPGIVPEAADDPVAFGPSRRRRRGRRLALPGLALLALALVTARYGPALLGSLDADGGVLERSLAELGIERERIPLAVEPKSAEPGTVVPLLAEGGAAGADASGEASRSDRAAADAESDPGLGETEAAGRQAEPAAGAAGRPAPYSLHVGSYQEEQSARVVVDRLGSAGHTAFLAPVSLPDKGRWLRVYVGSFADSTAARRTLEDLLRRELVSEGAVRSTPWTFQLGTSSSREAAAERIAALRGQGISAYAAGMNPIRIYAGAYASREEAELLARALDSTSRAARFTLREL